MEEARNPIRELLQGILATSNPFTTATNMDILILLTGMLFSQIIHVMDERATSELSLYLGI